MLLPVFASIVIAYLLDDVVEMMVRFHVPRTRAVWLVFMLFIAFLIFILFGLTPLVSAQLTLFVSELPSMLGKGQKMLLELPEQYPLISQEQVVEAIGAMRKQVTGFGQGLLGGLLLSGAGGEGESHHGGSQQPGQGDRAGHE